MPPAGPLGDGAGMPGTACPTAPTEPAPGPAARSVDALVDATPASRDRVVDLVRAVSIAVVVLWHWAFSVLHWGDGELRMPNPIGEVPGLWAATWLLQVMPLFFVVGGYANLAGWTAAEREAAAARAAGGPGPSATRRFLARRLARLGRPVAMYVAAWAAVDLVVRAGGGRSVLDWGMVVFVPLWFLGVYVAVVALVPVTARLHAAAGHRVLLALGAAVLAADAIRFAGGVGGAGLVTSVLVWVACHQLGYAWRDGTLTAGGRRTAATLAAGGLAALAVLTALGPYPRSMVAVRGEELSNMFPTTACVAALAVLQLGVVLLARPALTRWLARRGPWRAVVAANGVAMTVFCWHMTALVVVVGAAGAAGVTLGDEPTAAWWLARPFWVVAPGVVLAALVAVFGRVELPAVPGPAKRRG